MSTDPEIDPSWDGVSAGPLRAVPGVQGHHRDTPVPPDRDRMITSLQARQGLLRQRSGRSPLRVRHHGAGMRPGRVGQGWAGRPSVGSSW